MDNNFIENLKDIIRRYENDDEQQHAAANQWKLAAELLMDDCRALHGHIESLNDYLVSMRLCNERKRADELAKRIDKAIEFIENIRCKGIVTISTAAGIYKILNGKDGE